MAIGPASIPRLGGVGINTNVFWYTAGASVLAGLLFAVLPTIQTGTTKVKAVVADGGCSSTVGGDRLRLRGLMIVIQVGLAVVLLIGSGLMVRSFQQLRSVDPGFDPDGVITFGLTLPAARYSDAAERSQFLDQLLERVRALPGVEAAGATTALPLGFGSSFTTEIEGFPTGPDEFPHIFSVRWVTPGYFEAMRIPIISGRTIQSMADEEQLGTLFISSSLKEQFWPNASPIGKWLQPAGIRGEVAGVIGDVHTFGLDTPPDQTIYLAARNVPASRPRAAWSILVRSSDEVSDLVPLLRSQVGAIDSALPLRDIRTMDAVVADSFSMSRTSFTMLLLVLAALVAVFLGSVGIYGVISYVVSQRTSELGVRQALGADSAGIRSLVLRRGMTSTRRAPESAGNTT